METEFDLGNVFVTVEIEYKIWEGEPMVMYDPDGGGYPGSPAEIDILVVSVTSVSGETYDLNAEQLAKHEWAGDLDRIAFDHVDKNVHEGGWLADHIGADAAAAEEDWR